MNNYLLTKIITAFGVGIVCSLLGILVGKNYEQLGMARNQPLSVFIWSVVTALFVEFLLSPSFLWLFVMCTMFAIVGPYRFDLAQTYHKGKWWWLEEAGSSPPKTKDN